ncbi:MAG: hypothetical protein ACREO1_14880 [Arenimonas sp.]
MTVQSVSIASMFGWVVDSFKLINKNSKSLIAASGLTMLCGFLICIPMWLAMAAGVMAQAKNGMVPAAGMPMADMTMFYIVYAVTIIISLFLFPPILIGWFKLCQNIDQNNSVSGFDIFKPYKDKQLWLRGISFALIALVIYAAFMGLFVLAFSGAIQEVMQQVQAQQLAVLSGATPPPPSFPFSLILGYFGFIAVAMSLQFVYMIGFTEVSLRRTPALEAMKLAAVGVLKNALMLIVFMMAVSMLAFFVFFIFAMILAIVMMVLSLIHPMLGAIGMLLFYIPLFLLMYPLMFAGHYFMWKSMLGGDQPAIPNADDSSLPA